MSVFFDGQLLVTPVTASAINDDAMANQNLTVGNVAAFVGSAQGGEPKTVLSFGNPEEARSVLRGGELLTAVLKAFDPSADTGAPSTVRVVRINPAVQATLALQSAGSTNVVNLRARNWGGRDNQIKVKIEAGSVSGKRLTAQYANDVYSADNVGRAAFSVVYSGPEESATITVGASTVTLVSGAEPPIVIDLEEFRTLESLVDRINSVSGFSAALLDNNAARQTYNGLDFVAAQSVMTEYTVRADLQAIVDWFNGQNQPLLWAEREDAVGAIPANIPFTYLAGGSEGATTITDWADSFAALQQRDVQWVSPISGDPAIHAMCDTHVAFCSSVMRRERRAICGTAIGTTDSAALDEAKALNSPRTSLVHIGYYDYDQAGNLTLLAPYQSAALVAAAFSGTSPGTPLTNKTIKVRGLERDLRNPTDTDELILGGVLCLENTDDGYKVVKSISTWLGDSKYTRVEQSVGVALDFTVRNVRNAVDILRGQKANPLLLSRAKSIAESTLRELARPEPEGPGVLAGDEDNPAYRNITASIEGDVVRLQFECSPVLPANYVLVTVYAVPYSSAVAA